MFSSQRCLILLVFFALTQCVYVKSKARIYKKSIDQNKIKSNVILCDLTDLSRAKKPCHTDSFHFTFSALFHKEFRVGNMKTLGRVLSDYAVCETYFMKFNNQTQSLDYFSTDDNYIWFKNKKLNDTLRPEVSIVKDSESGTKKIVFKCPLPKSDVFISIYGDSQSPKSGQSHPLINQRVTISGLHLRLSFLQMESLSVRVKGKRDESYSIIDKLKNFNINSALEFLPKQSTERFFVYFDSKCRDCQVENSIEKFSPNKLNSLICVLKNNSCEYKGECLKDKQIYTPLKFNSEEEKPTLNSFICLSNFSQTSLYMPCSIKNGNCAFNQTCSFDAVSLDVKCESS